MSGFWMLPIYSMVMFSFFLFLLDFDSDNQSFIVILVILIFIVILLSLSCSFFTIFGSSSSFFLNHLLIYSWFELLDVDKKNKLVHQSNLIFCSWMCLMSIAKQISVETNCWLFSGSFKSNPKISHNKKIKGRNASKQGITTQPFVEEKPFFFTFHYFYHFLYFSSFYFQSPVNSLIN